MPATQALCANACPLSLHAGVRFESEQRSDLEQLRRYVTRLAIANERHALAHIRGKEQFELKVLVTADHSFAEEARTQDVVILMPEELGILVSAMLPPIAI